MNQPSIPIHAQPAKRVVLWRVTQQCNLGCHFCSYSNEVERVRGVANPPQVERFGKLLGDYSEQRGREVLVSWIGGEPFLWPSLLDISSKFVNDFGLEISCTTNGLPLRSPAIRKQVLEGFSELVVSVDGLGAATDLPRQKPGLFEELKRNLCELTSLKEAQGRNLRLKVNTILMRHNIDHFERFCEEMMSWGVQELTFNQLGGYDRPEFFPANRLLPEQVRRFADSLPEWRTCFARRGLLIHGSDAYLHRFICSSLEQKISIADCSPGAWFWFVNESGLISPCSYTSYEYAVDIDLLSTIGDLDCVELKFRAERESARSRFCDDCHCTQVHDKFS